MPLTQFNPSTGKVSYVNANDKVQVSSVECNLCAAPPQTVQCETFDVATCEGLGNCIRGETAKDKPLSYGIGWNQVSILTPGRALAFGPGSGGGNDFKKEDPNLGGTPAPCWWSEIVRADFGYFDTYSQNECTGDVLGRTYWHVRVCQVYVTANTCNVTVKLGYQGYKDGNIVIFNKNHPFEANGACFPYGQTIETDKTCLGDVRHGYGTAKLTAT